MNTYTIKENSLIIDNTVIKFQFPIAEVISILNMLIVRLESPIGIIFNENVFGISLSEKTIKWQIKKRHFRIAGSKECPYVSIKEYHRKIRLNKWCSIYLIVDPITGNITEEGETR